MKWLWQTYISRKKLNLSILQNFATFTEEKIVAHYHFISCDTDSLVLFLGLII